MTLKSLGILIMASISLTGCNLFQGAENSVGVGEPIGDNPASSDEMAGPPASDDAMVFVDSDTMMAMMKMPFAFSGNLEDVTEGATIRGLATGGRAGGTAKAGIIDSNYSLLATFTNLPDPKGSDFYEGWIVRKKPFNFISTGAVEVDGGAFINAYESESDLTDHDFYVLTIEPDDGDPAPADHIVEGTMTRSDSQ